MKSDLLQDLFDVEVRSSSTDVFDMPDLEGFPADAIEPPLAAL